MRKLTKSLVVLLPFALVACTETQFLNTLGAGKTSPDEQVVASNQPLIMPPDLSLRPPQPGEVQTQAAPAPAPAQTQAAPLDPALNQAPAPLQQQAALNPNQPSNPLQELDQAYIKYGISKFRPDGSPKTTEELQKELNAAIIAEKKKNNPNYGTIWNLPEFLGF